MVCLEISWLLVRKGRFSTAPGGCTNWRIPAQFGACVSLCLFIHEEMSTSLMWLDNTFEELNWTFLVNSNVLLFVFLNTISFKADGSKSWSCWKGLDWYGVRVLVEMCTIYVIILNVFVNDRLIPWNLCLHLSNVCCRQRLCIYTIFVVVKFCLVTTLNNKESCIDCRNGAKTVQMYFCDWHFFCDYCQFRY
jgi:hypothetical protein